MTAEGQAVLVAQGKVRMPSVGWKGEWRGARKRALTKNASPARTLVEASEVHTQIGRPCPLRLDSS